VTLNVLGHQSNESDQTFARLGQFEQQTGAKVNFQIVPVADYDKKVTAEFVAKTGAVDVLQLSNTTVTLAAKNKWIVPLDDYAHNAPAPDFQLDDFIPAVMDNIGLYQNGLWIIPWRADVRALYYRSDVLDAKGVKPPATWDEYFGVLDKVTSAPDLYGIGIHARQYGGTLAAFGDVLWNHGGDYLAEDMRPRFNDERGVQALDDYVKLLNYAPPDKLNMGALEVDTAFAQGRVAFAHEWPQLAAAAVDEKQSKVVGKFGLAPLPTLPGGKSISGIGGWGIGISADSKQKDAAWRLVQFLTTARAEKEVILAGGDANPCHISTLKDPQLAQKFFYFPQLFPNFENGKAAPRIPEWSQIADAIVLAMSEAATGKKASKAALDDAANTTDGILKKAGYYK
jgi:multiple sugar transport system substrate-binding protein